MIATRKVEIPRVKGTYALIILLRTGTTISVGALGSLQFPAGYYVYVGSAQGGLEARLQYHLRPKTQYHWHIDYFLAHAHLHSVWYQAGGNQECSMARDLAEICTPVLGFGSSDCQCSSHLFHSSDLTTIHGVLLAHAWKEILG